MKKITLLALSLFALTASAQVSFETSEGYSVGNITGQNGWGGTSAAHIAEVSTDYAAGFGAQSLKIEGNNGTNHASAGAISGTNAYNDEVVTLSFQAYFTPSPTTGNECDFFFSAQSPSQTSITSRLRFVFDGTISIVDFNSSGTLAYIPTGATFTTGQWYTFTVVHDFVNGTITYKKDDVTFFTGTVFAATNVENLAITSDNFESSAYFDEISIVGSTLANYQVSSSKFSVYPNPANNVINVTNSDNATISAIEMTDINGRVVKSVKFTDLAQAQVSVSDLAQGVYTMKIVSDKGTTVKKVIKE